MAKPTEQQEFGPDSGPAQVTKPLLETHRAGVIEAIRGFHERRKTSRGRVRQKQAGQKGSTIVTPESSY